MSFWRFIYFICCVFQVFSEPIIGGTNAPPRTFTYQVSLEDEDGHFCGGSIISKYWVLTAAHCVLETNVRVVSGSVYRDEGIRHAVKSIVVHEEYNDTTLENDIAVIQLRNSIVFNKDTQAIKLSFCPPPPFDVYATATGWGFNDESLRIYPNRLQMLNVETISFGKCLEYEPIDPNEPLVRLTEGNHFCVINSVGLGPCNGDSGGPIVWDGAQIGIVTFGAEKCAIGKPVMCTTISAFRYWIFEKTGV